MADEVNDGVGFPVRGVDVSTEFGRQPADTAYSATNVRAYEAGTGRARGGSRSGLTLAVPDRVVGEDVIQHLNIIVDPTTPALSADADATYPDPSTSNLSPRVPPGGRRVRRGGSGVWVRGNDPNDDSGTGYKLKRSAAGNSDVDGYVIPSLTVPFTPSPGNLVVVSVGTIGLDLTNVGLSVRLSGNSLTQIGSYLTTTNIQNPVQSYRLSMWYAIAGVGQTEVTVTGDNAALVYAHCLEFSGNPPGPFDQTAGQSATTVSALSAGLVPCGGPKELVVATALLNNGVGLLDSQVSGFAGSVLVLATAASMYTVYARNVASPGLVAGVNFPQTDLPLINYAAMGASFRKA